MWYATNREKTKLTKAEKEMRDAQRFLKWGPWIALAAAALLIFGVCKTAQQPTLEHMLKFGAVVGAALAVYADWRNARAKVKGLRDVLADSISMVALMIWPACLVLGGNDMIRDKPTFDAVGCLFLVMFLCTLAIAISDYLRGRRKRHDTLKAERNS